MSEATIGTASRRFLDGFAAGASLKKSSSWELIIKSDLKPECRFDALK
jgi:hypothetical protein